MILYTDRHVRPQHDTLIGNSSRFLPPLRHSRTRRTGIKTKRINDAPAMMQHMIEEVANARLCDCSDEADPYVVLVATKKGCERVAAAIRLVTKSVVACAHGDMYYAEQQKEITGFLAGESKVRLPAPGLLLAAPVDFGRLAKALARRAWHPIGLAHRSLHTWPLKHQLDPPFSPYTTHRPSPFQPHPDFAAVVLLPSCPPALLTRYS